MNVLHGLNGSGKTTVLEAIAVASFSKSFLPAPDSSLVRRGEEGFYVSVRARSDHDSPYRVSVAYRPGTRKKISSNAGDHLSPKDIIGELPLVILSPDYKPITFGSPADRRQFADRALSQASKRYVEDMIDLKKILRQRNNLLSDARAGRWFDHDLLDPWTEKLINTGAEVVIRRKRFVDEFRPYFRGIYEKVSGGKEVVDIYYEPNGINSDEIAQMITAEDVRAKYETLAGELADDELRRGTTAFGPQKDELRITINDGLAREYASQGQHKSLLISIKFAEFEYLKDKKNETPVILLDDIFSELDSRRSRLVIDLLKINRAQTFITVTETERLKEFMTAETDNKFFRVEGGNVELSEIK